MSISIFYFLYNMPNIIFIQKSRLQWQAAISQIWCIFFFFYSKKKFVSSPIMPLYNERLYANIITDDNGNGKINCFYTENILRSLNMYLVLQSDKIFYSKEFFRKIIFSSSLLWLFLVLTGVSVRTFCLKSCVKSISWFNHYFPF